MGAPRYRIVPAERRGTDGSSCEPCLDAAFSGPYPGAGAAYGCGAVLKRQASTIATSQRTDRIKTFSGRALRERE